MSEQRPPWIDIPEGSDFSIHNLPFGIFSREGQDQRVGAAIGAYVIDLHVAYTLGAFPELMIDKDVLVNEYLNDFIRLGKYKTNLIREQLQKQLCDDASVLKNSSALIPMDEVRMHLPVRIGDYTDFYSSLEHATNVGKMFRDRDNALLPNWRHLPVAYHGRSSSIVPSGTDIHRPKGQLKPEGGDPFYAPTQKLDFELELGFIIGKDSSAGCSIPADRAGEYIFGMVLFNDWSARDIQKWEYVPLGPFLGKSFASSVSPWVVPLEALEPFRCPGPVQQPEVLPYLRTSGNQNYDLKLEVQIQAEGSALPTTVCKTNFKHMYWNMAQQLAHHTSNGCNVRVGDLMASGTISGSEPESFGSMLELSWNGSTPVVLNNGDERSFLEDGDTVIMKGFGEKDGIRVGFGELRSKILPAKS